MNLQFKIFTIAFLCLVSLLKAQEVQLGFRFESNGVKVKYGNESFPFAASPLGFQVNASILPIDNLALEARAALMMVKYYDGIETGLLARYYFAKPVYFIAGVINHKFISRNNVVTEGLVTWYSNEANLLLPAVGAGINIPFRKGGDNNFKFDLELMYQFTGNKTVGHKVQSFYDNLWHTEDERFIPLKLSYALKISLGVSFVLL